MLITVHSYNGGTGKSSSAGNIAALMAMQGLRVALVDADIQCPGLHVLFGIDQNDMQPALRDYLTGEHEIEEAAYEVTDRLGASDVGGCLYVIPSHISALTIARLLEHGYDAGLLTEGFRRLIDVLLLDVLIVDTHPGMNDESLLSLAVSDAVAVVLRPCAHDYEGSHVMVSLARRLHAPNILLLVNMVPSDVDLVELRAHVEEAYGCEAAALVPYCSEMAMLRGENVFVLEHPDHQITAMYQSVVNRLLSERKGNGCGATSR